MNYQRNPKYLHPFIAGKLPQILAAITAKLPAGHRPKIISLHRTPADQFALYKQGRTFKNGTWVKTGAIVTSKDGYTKPSRHNYLPATAIDIGIFKGDAYLGNTPLYQHIAVAKTFGLDWGGDWKGLVDQPHLEMSLTNMFRGNIDKDNGKLWQQYLLKAGTYSGVLDGIFGPRSIEALTAATGQSTRNLAAWDALYDAFGALL